MNEKILEKLNYVEKSLTWGFETSSHDVPGVDGCPENFPTTRSHYDVGFVDNRIRVALETIEEIKSILVPTKVSCPECGDSDHYRIIYTDDEKTDVKYYDCMMCHTHWDKDGNNLGKY